MMDDSAAIGPRQSWAMRCMQCGAGHDLHLILRKSRLLCAWLRNAQEAIDGNFAVDAT
jgi:hypothetical protein